MSDKGPLTGDKNGETRKAPSLEVSHTKMFSFARHTSPYSDKTNQITLFLKFPIFFYENIYQILIINVLNYAFFSLYYFEMNPRILYVKQRKGHTSFGNQRLNKGSIYHVYDNQVFLETYFIISGS